MRQFESEPPLFPNFCFLELNTSHQLGHWLGAFSPYTLFIRKISTKKACIPREVGEDARFY